MKLWCQINFALLSRVTDLARPNRVAVRPWFLLDHHHRPFFSSFTPSLNRRRKTRTGSMDSADATDTVTVARSRRAMDRARIADIEAEISYLEQSIRALRIEQVQAQKRLGSYSYPILTLPNEITTEIFIAFLPVYSIPPQMHGLCSPMRLTRICRQWRDIVYTTPALWRAISLVVTTPTCDEKDNNLLQKWLARSCIYRLCINISGDFWYESQCMRTLSSHRARWEHLELSYVTYDILLYLRGPMPSLRHLDISFQDELSGAITVGDAPLLCSVRLVSYVDNVVLPWSQLTSLNLESVFPHECTVILKQTTLLVHCKLSFISYDDERDPQPDTELPFLESFVLMKGDLLQKSYLYSLILPALATLQIPEGDLEPNPIGGLKSFLSKSGCTLRELYITGNRNFTTAAYHRAFPTIPRISFEDDGDELSELESGSSNSDTENTEPE
ncbi:hypothetical protein C8R43DRAFT_1148085 [Mycena crocata]|nr:hypothetical protein C8R43DRAFT_1148085 [Mycena crocata]